MGIRIGVAGVGKLGREHVRLLSADERVTQVVCYDTQPDRAAQVAATFGATAAPDLREMLDAVDAISIVVPTTEHFRVAEMALELHKDVFVEKPIAASAEQARDMIELAAAHDRILQVGHVERFNGIIQTIGVLSEPPQFIEVHRLAPFSVRGTDVSVVGDLMIHDLDLLRFLLGESPIDVRAYPEQVDDLIGFLGDRLPPEHPFSELRPGPKTEGMPEIWLLGSGIDSAKIAADRGLPFSFAHFFGQAAKGPAIVEYYRQHFQPSDQAAEPKVHIAVQVMCADSQERAEWHASSLRLGRIKMARNETSEGIVSPEEASRHPFTAEELRFLENSGMRGTTGDLARVVAELDDLSDQYATDHFGIVTICYDFKARLHSYELLAEAYLD